MQLFIKKYITAVSVRWQHCIDHADKQTNAGKGPDCLIGVVPQPTDSRVSETSHPINESTIKEVIPIKDADHLAIINFVIYYDDSP